MSKKESDMQAPELLQHLNGIPEDVVLHGSPFLVSTIEPRQAVQEGGPPEANELGVYATWCARIAILYAVIHANREEWGWKADFKVSQDIKVVAPDNLKGGKGYVYLLPKSAFKKTFGEGLCYIAHEPITPLEVIEIHPTVLEYLQTSCGVCFKLPPAA